MRKFIAAVLATPVLATVIFGSLVRRTPRRRSLVGVAGGLAILLAIAAIGAAILRPAPVTGTPPTHEVMLPASEFTTEIVTGASPVAPIVVSFAVPMNPVSVEQLLRIEPAAAVTVAWDSTHTVLTVSPMGVWTPGTLHTVTVESGALDTTGRPLDRRVRATFLTRPATTATIAPTVGTPDDAGIATAFRITFSGPIDDSTLQLLVLPPVPGTLRPVAGPSASSPTFDFVPGDPLEPDTAYTVSLGPDALDQDGAPIAAKAITVRTAAASAVVRFRPRDGSADVARGDGLSVRFTEPMDHASTQAAWSATAGGTAIAGSFHWAENDTVLLFDPKVDLGYSQKVEMRVGTGARSRAGVPLDAAASATFTTVARPTTTGGSAGGSSGTGSTGSTGTGSLGSGTWAAVEAYYLKLMNCTRTGGTVSSSGACFGEGMRKVAPLWQDAGISSAVSRPYAKKLVLGNLCTHYSGGTPSSRLQAAGYTSYVWAENVGCEGGNPYSAVLGDHRFFQAERSRNGGHYVNLMNAKYDRCGIGVWAVGSRVRLVIDFYHPL